MTISLQKGQRADLSKIGLTNFYVGLGWETNTRGGADFDLDVSVFILNGGTLTEEKNFVFFNNLTDSRGAVKHAGDNRTGNAAGDDEQLRIDLSKLDAGVDEIPIVVTIYEAIKNNQNFGQVNNAYVRICELNADGSPGTEVYRVDLSEDYSAYTALVFGSIYNKGGDWKFVFQGDGFKAEIGDILSQYQQPAQQTA